MAITPTFCYVIESLFTHGFLPQNCAILEIGEANWYGKLQRDELVAQIEQFVADPVKKQQLAARVDEILAKQEISVRFDLVKVFYEVFFSPRKIEAIDFHGGYTAHRLDLNAPIRLDGQFDVVINHGTAEHIFRIAQVFETMHNHALPGGLMIHESPFTGWIDHGFYNLHPTLFYDLADYNGYLLLGMFIEDIKVSRLIQIHSRDHVHELARAGQIPENAVLMTVLQKNPTEAPFQVPQQGYYREALTEEGRRAWERLR